MAFTFASVADASAQYLANQPWNQSIGSAQLCMAAIDYLLMNRGEQLADQSSSIKFEALGQIRSDIVKFLGATAPRAFGRSRFVGISPCPVQGPS